MRNLTKDDLHTFEQVPLPIAVVRLSDGLICYVNDLSVHRFGLAFGIGIEKDVRTTDFYVYPEDRVRFIETLSQAGHLENFEVHLRRVDGSRFWGSLSASLGNFEGETIAVCSVIDLTPIKSALAMQDFYGELIERLNESLILVSAKTRRIVFANTRADDLFGYPNGGLVNRCVDVLNMGPRDEAKSTADAIIDAVRNDGQWVGEVRNKKNDGEEFWTRAIVSTLDHPKHGLLAVSFQEDITRRKMAEDRLHANEAMYRPVVEGLGELVCRFRPDWTRTFVNDAYCRYVGLPRDELLDRSFMPMVAEEDRQKLKQALDSLSPENPTITTQHGIQLPDGSEAWLRWTDRAIFDVDGYPVEYQGVGQDFTQEKHLNDELENARRVAEEAARSKADFIATMSHELRNPLGGIIGMAEVLSGTPLHDNQRHCTDVIIDSASSMLAILDDVLNYLKTETGTLVIASIRFSVRDIVTRAVELYRTVAKQRELTLQTRIDDDVPESLIGDARLLRQILINLLGNAVKFTKHGGVLVRVASEGTEGERLKIRFSVLDTGVGLGNEAREKLFKWFGESQPDVGNHQPGSGLGLAICRRFVEAMGGVIDVVSAPGRGSNFWFELPFETEPLIGNGVSPPDDDDLKAMDRVLPRLSVLVVDDSAISRDVVVAFLERAGHEASAVSSGGEAVALASGQSFDVILMDVEMPEFDGIVATRAIRRLHDPERANVPIVAMTGRLTQKNVDRFAAAGMTDLLPKPIRWSSLSDTLSRVCLSSAIPSVPRPASRDVVSPVIDERVVDVLLQSLGRTGLVDLLARFEDESGFVLDEGERRFNRYRDKNDLAQRFHSMASAAGALGLIFLARQCHELEKSLLAGSDDAGSELSAIRLLHADSLRVLKDTTLKLLNGIGDVAREQIADAVNGDDDLG